MATRRSPACGYQNLAQKLQADLARVGIKAELAPMDQVNMRTMYPRRQARGGADLLEPAGAGELAVGGATIDRVAGRVHWKVPPEVRKLVADAAAERDLAKGAALCRQYQEAMVDAAHHFVLIQPVYQVAVRKSVVRPATDGGGLDGRAGRSEARLMHPRSPVIAAEG